MRRWGTLLLALLLLFTLPGARAEIQCNCGMEACVCFIQWGDIGPAVKSIRETLKEQGYLSETCRSATFNEDYENAVRDFQRAHLLPETGMMDDLTLTWLLWGMSPDEVTAAYPDSETLVMWVAVNGGKRAHIDYDCGQNGAFDLYFPRMVTLRNVYKLGIRPCKNCSGSLLPQK